MKLLSTMNLALGQNAILSILGLFMYCAKACDAPSQATLSAYNTKIAPKVFIIGMFNAEGTIWHGIPEFNLLERNITVPGFSPLYPTVHCTSSGSVCQLITGAGEINAAATLSALLYSDTFDLHKSYFLIAGIAGISPKMGTIGGVTFPRYAVHVGLQFEIDAREVPDGFQTGYIPQGSEHPDQYPSRIYGTEVYELNDNLRQVAMQLAGKGTLYDDEKSREYRALYARSGSAYAPATAHPSIVACDTATADQFWSGQLLGEAMENVTRLLSNGSAVYCTTQQEDNASLEVLVRGAVRGVVDFTRVVIMRTGSDFDRPYEGQSAADNLFHGLMGFTSSIMNIRAAGVPIVMGILDGWGQKFERGIEATNYVGDILGSLGGQPEFGPGGAAFGLY